MIIDTGVTSLECQKTEEWSKMTQKDQIRGYFGNLCFSALS